MAYSIEIIYYKKCVRSNPSGEAYSMYKELWDVVNAAQELDIRVSDGPGHGLLRIGGNQQDFPKRLIRLKDALDKLEKAGAQDASMDPERLMAGIDGIFRWLRSQGHDVNEPFDILQQAMGVDTQKASKGGKRYAFKPKKHAKKKIPPLKLKFIDAEQDEAERSASSNRI